MGFAVVDLDTTGFNPERDDRIVEIAIVVTDPWFQQTDVFESLVDPGRDVGPTGIHGITDALVLAAPEFAALAPRVAAMLDGQVLVGHNLDFIERFLACELTSAGVEHDLGGGVCTLALAREQGWPLKLSGLVAHFGIDHGDAGHSSMTDALACLEVVRAAPWVTGTPFHCGRRGLDSNPTRPLSRQVARRAITRRAHFAAVPDVESIAAASYLDLVSTCLADGILGRPERTALNELIRFCRFSQDDVIDLHHRYLHSVIEAASADGAVDAGDWEAIATASRHLGVDIDVSRVMTASAAAEAGDGT